MDEPKTLLGYPVKLIDFDLPGTAPVVLGAERFTLRVTMKDDGTIVAKLADGYDDAARARFSAALIEMQNNAEKV